MNLTPTGFGIVVAILLIVAVIVAIAENLRDRWAEAGRMIDAAPGPDPYDDTCAIDGCTRTGATLFPSSTGVMFVCRFHAAQVSEWTGPALFDQEDGVA